MLRNKPAVEITAPDAEKTPGQPNFISASKDNVAKEIEKTAARDRTKRTKAKLEKSDRAIGFLMCIMPALLCALH